MIKKENEDGSGIRNKTENVKEGFLQHVLANSNSRKIAFYMM